MTDAETFSFHSSISIAISSAWCKLCRTIFHLKIKKWSPLWLLYPHHVGSYAELSALHVPVCCCNHGRPPIQQWWRGIKAVQTGSPIIKIENIFWGKINCFASPKPILIYEASSSKRNFSKIPRIITYQEFLKKSHSFTYLFPVIGN